MPSPVALANAVKWTAGVPRSMASARPTSAPTTQGCLSTRSMGAIGQRTLATGPRVVKVETP